MPMTLSTGDREHPPALQRQHVSIQAKLRCLWPVSVGFASLGVIGVCLYVCTVLHKKKTDINHHFVNCFLACIHLHNKFSTENILVCASVSHGENASITIAWSIA